MSKRIRILACVTALVMLLLSCAAAAADGRPGVWDVNFYARRGGRLLYTWQTARNGKLTDELRPTYRDGYVFMGWYTHPYGGIRITRDTVFRKDTNVWAHWGRVEGKVKEEPKPGVYTITFLEDDHSRTLPSAVQTGSDGRIGQLPEPTVEKVKDLKFIGWRNRKTLEKVTGDTVFTGNAILQAVWGSDSKVNLTYISDGCLLTNKAYMPGKLVDSFAGRPDNARGREFMGWYTAEEGGEKVSSLLMTEDTVLYARWSDPGFTVSFTGAYAFAEDGTQLAGNKLRTRSDGTLENIPGGISQGGLFTGWFADRNRTIPLTTDTVFTRDARVWAGVEKIRGIRVYLDVRKYGTNYVRVTPGMVPAREDGTLDVLPVPVWTTNGVEHRTFKGWFTADDQPVTKDTVFTGDTTIYAKWTEGCRISFSSAGRPAYKAAYTDENGKLALLPAVGRTLGGNAALGWYTKDGEKVTGDTVFTADAELVPKWGATVRFYMERNENGRGHGDAALLTTDENGRLPYLPETVHTKGYPFAGWTDENGNAVTADTIFTGDAKVYGTWEKDGNLIRLSGGRGGTPDVTSVRTRNDGTVAKLPSAHHKNGLPFAGWSATQDGNSPVADGAVFAEPVTTLYATWIPAYKVTFRPRGGTVVGGTQSVMTDDEGHVAEWPAAEHPLKLHFDGWYVGSGLGAAKGGPDSVFTRDTWVDARWSVPEVPAGGFTVTLSDRDSSRQENTRPDGRLKGLSALHRSDAVFYGWFTEPFAGGQKVQNGTQVGGDMTFYAAWLIPLTAAEDR